MFIQKQNLLLKYYDAKDMFEIVFKGYYRNFTSIIDFQLKWIIGFLEIITLTVRSTWFNHRVASVLNLRFHNNWKDFHVKNLYLFHINQSPDDICFNFAFAG